MTQSTESCNTATRYYAQLYPVITGNIVPHQWYSYIKSESGKPDQNAIAILSEIVYWYKPGRGGKPKFQGDLWQTSYEHFHKRFGYDHQKTRRAFVRLEELGIIKREYRTIEIRGHKYSNVLFIELLTLDIQTSFSSSFKNTKKISSPIVKFDDPSLQICREHIEEENKRENIESRSNDESEFFKNILENSSLEVFSSTTTSEINLDSTNSLCKEHPENEQPIELVKESIDELILSKTQRSSLKITESNQTVNLRALKDFLPLTEELYTKIQTKTSKNYKLCFVNQLLEKLSLKYPFHEFPNEKAFASYMAKSLDNEILEEKIANLENFSFDPNYRKNLEAKKFLSLIEDSTDSNLDILLKKKVVALFEDEDAYSILKNYKFPDKIVEGKYLIEKIRVGDGCEYTLSCYQKERIFKEIEHLFDIDHDFIQIVDAKFGTKEKTINTESRVGEIGDSCWSMVRKRLIEQFAEKGDALDKSWFSKLDMQESIDKMSAVIVAPTKFVADWMRTNYFCVIKTAVEGLFPAIEHLDIKVYNES